MRRLFLTSFVALLAIWVPTSTAVAKTPKPSVTSVSPSQVAIGGTLVLKGKNFRSGARNNTVFLWRATDGKAVRAKPKRATKTRIEVVVPRTVSKFLIDGKATRFQISVFTTVLGSKTRTSRSPLIFPEGSAPTPGTGTPGTPTTPGATPPPAPDCDSDGTPDAQDSDDDNDGLPDDLEKTLGTAICGKDSDADGVEDGYEYWAAKDLNANAVPYPGKKPYPNPLDGSDSNKDFDQDGLTLTEEFMAWNLYGGRVLPTADGQSFPYSDGNQTSTAGNGLGGGDYDNNGKVTDEEKDADGDGLANWVELAKGSTTDAVPMDYGRWHKSAPACTDFAPGNVRYQDCGAGPVPNGNTFTDGFFPSYYKPNWLDPDTDGDGVNDAADDLDHDDVSNAAEIAAQANPVNPCDPNPDSRTCTQH